MAAEPSVCPSCDGTETVPIHRAGSNKWRYRCAACLATWVGKRRAQNAGEMSGQTSGKMTTETTTLHARD